MRRQLKARCAFAEPFHTPFAGPVQITDRVLRLQV